MSNNLQADNNTVQSHNDIKVHTNVNFRGPLIIAGGLFGIPVLIYALIVLVSMMIFHWKSFDAMSPQVFEGVIWAIKAGVVLVLLFFGFKVAQEGSKALKAVIEAIQPLVFLFARNKVIHDNGATIAYLGEVKFHNATQVKYNVNTKMVDGSVEQEQLLLDSPDDEEEKEAIPDYVTYDEVKPRIPQGKALVGIAEGGTIETKDDAVRASIWIVGGSGAGKTNSEMIRIDEDYEAGHFFLVADPHAFKDDSLANALKGTKYMSRLLMPIAQSPEEIVQVLQFFLNEFKTRKAGASWQKKITILVDEVNSLNEPDKENEVEVEVLKCLKIIARITGTESRNFGMAGKYISQVATGLAWLRKYALMVIAHQVLMYNERLLVCNQDAQVARAMDTWPIGRTLVYGIAFTAGPKIVQQPLFHVARRKQESDVFTLLSNAQPKEATETLMETASEANGYDTPAVSFSAFPVATPTLKKETDENETVKRMVKRMLERDMPAREIAQITGMTGRRYAQLQEMIEEIKESATPVHHQ